MQDQICPDPSRRRPAWRVTVARRTSRLGYWLAAAAALLGQTAAFASTPIRWSEPPGQSASQIVIRPESTEAPALPRLSVGDSSAEVHRAVPIDADAYLPQRTIAPRQGLYPERAYLPPSDSRRPPAARSATQPARYLDTLRVATQPPGALWPEAETETMPSPAGPIDAAEACAAMVEKPLGQLTIGIAVPDGTIPADQATRCWQQINASSPAAAARRPWALSNYQWDATCLCHRPLYFEEINLERHGYGCCECLQPAASAAHFFATVPALPYCMVADCPNKCIYTLGHYRPGSCPPWRHNWPPCEPVAGAAETGVLVGLIFLIP